MSLPCFLVFLLKKDVLILLNFVCIDRFHAALFSALEHSLALHMFCLFVVVVVFSAYCVIYCSIMH